MDGFHSRLCTHNAVKDGYCSIHQPEAKAKRQEKKEKGWADKKKIEERRWEYIRLGADFIKCYSEIEMVLRYYPFSTSDILKRIMEDARKLKEG